MNITRRKVLLGASVLLCAPVIRSSRAATFWYVQPPPLLQARRADGVHALTKEVQRDRIIGARTRAATSAGKVFDFSRVGVAGTACAKFDDPTYQALLRGDRAIFSDCAVVNSIGVEHPDTTPIALTNWGAHPQLCVMIGDSLMESGAGNSRHPELLLPQNQCWAQPVVSKSAPFTTTGNYSAFWNKSAYTDDATQPRARIVWNFAFGGWRLATLPGVNYPGTTGGWADQRAYLQAIPVAPGQQIAFIIQAGSNDAHETLGPRIMYHGRPEFGRPNMIEDGLAPLVSVIRGLYPPAQFPRVKIGVMTPIARWWAPTGKATNGQRTIDWANAQFSAYADWLTTPGNAASIAVDAVWDSRIDQALDCRNAAVVCLDETVYQADKTHLTANGYVNHLGPGATRLLDGFWT